MQELESFTANRGGSVIEIIEIITAVLFIVVIAHVVWSYRQGSFPASRLRQAAKRAARLTRQLDREDDELASTTTDRGNAH
ncbi:MAG: hypothetical protein JSW51_14120 [Gemmatimonadota bacterium]|nr:MAG: hypothetical protein JSW51_14120 [Gemmatimonadota bacterium]